MAFSWLGGARKRPEGEAPVSVRRARSERYQAANYVPTSSDVSDFMEEFEYEDDYLLTSIAKSGTFEE